MPEPTVTYTPLPDAKPETEVRTLANVYSFVLRCANKNALGVTSTKGDEVVSIRFCKSG